MKKYDKDLYKELDYLKGELSLSESIVKEQRTDIKVLILSLIENDIPIPENLISKYINKKSNCRFRLDWPSFSLSVGD